MRAAAMVCLVLIGGCSTVSEAVLAPTAALLRPAMALLSTPADQMHAIPVTTDEGEVDSLSARICRSAEDVKTNAKLPVAVINHGGPGPDAERSAMSPARCDSPAVRWFLDRHYVVVLPMRRGYGESEGGWAQNPGSCASPDYVRAAREGGRDLDAAISYALTLPFTKSEGAVMVGEDEGGWAVLGYASEPRATHALSIDIAGGMGGRAARLAGRTCRPDLLVDAAGVLGQRARDRMVWIFAADDKVFSPELMTRMFNAFKASGGNASLEQTKPVGGDGHALLFNPNAARIWAPLFAKFLTT